MIDKKLLAKFIEIGKMEDFDRLQKLFPPNEIESKGYIMRQGFQVWYDIADSLSVEDIAAIMKTLTIAEKTLCGWKAGSVSPVGWLGRKLVERDKILVDQVAKWVVSHTDNPYLPFGRYNAKSVAEYKAKPFKDFARQTALLEAEEDRKKQACERRKKKAQTHKLFLEEQREKQLQRNKLLNKLDVLTLEERFCFIVKDKRHPIDYYPEKYANVNESILKSIKPEVKKKLIQKIGKRKKGIWKKLADILSG